MKATNIKWDVDSAKDRQFLPKTLEIPKNLDNLDDISDYLSDETGFCHDGFDIKSSFKKGDILLLSSGGLDKVISSEIKFNDDDSVSEIVFCKENGLISRQQIKTIINKRSNKS